MTPVLLLLPLFLAAPAELPGVDDPVPPDAARTVVDLVFENVDLIFRVENTGGAVTDMQIAENDLEVRLDLSADVLFAFDKAELQPEAKSALTKAASAIHDKAAKNSEVRIEGHTDSKGSKTYNQALSERRAKSVREALEKAGVTGVNWSIQGLGAARPVVPNQKPDGTDDPAGRAKNRRVEIVIHKR